MISRACLLVLLGLSLSLFAQVWFAGTRFSLFQSEKEVQIEKTIPIDLPKRGKASRNVATKRPQLQPQAQPGQELPHCTENCVACDGPGYEDCLMCESGYALYDENGDGRGSCLQQPSTQSVTPAPEPLPAAPPAPMVVTPAPSPQATARPSQAVTPAPKPLPAVRIVAGIVSKFEWFHWRSAHRSTWMRSELVCSDDFGDPKSCVFLPRFVIDSASIPHKDKKRMEAESKAHGDVYVVRGDHRTKVLHWLEAVTHHWPQANLVVKMDMDTFVQPWMLLEDIRRGNPDSMFYGYMTGVRGRSDCRNGYGKRRKTSGKRWTCDWDKDPNSPCCCPPACNLEDGFSGNCWQYAQGAFYMMSMKFAKWISEHSKKLVPPRAYECEDILMGHWMHTMNRYKGWLSAKSSVVDSRVSEFVYGHVADGLHKANAAGKCDCSVFTRSELRPMPFFHCKNWHTCPGTRRKPDPPGRRRYTNTMPSADLRSAGVHAHIDGFALCGHVAVLISGQLHRFTWKDALLEEDIFVCPVDIYLVLHNANTEVHFTGPVPQRPPYSGTNVTQLVADIEQHFHAKGAAEISITILEDAELHAAAGHIEEQVLSKYSWWHAAKHKRQVHLQMLYMRHKAFKAAVDSGRPYDTFLYLRDDNRFIRPLQHIPAFTKPLPKSGRFVLVDHHCGFSYYSDKIYLTDRDGANCVFTGSDAEFKMAMNFWGKLGMKSDKGHHDSGQTERYLEKLMESCNAKVVKAEFARTDFRYVASGGKLQGCFPQRYAHCHNKAWSKHLGISGCPE